MTKVLDGRFFTSVGSKEGDGLQYTVYRTLGYPMVLQSEVDGTYLAALHLRCQDTFAQSDHDGTRGRAIIAERQPPLKPHSRKPKTPAPPGPSNGDGKAASDSKANDDSKPHRLHPTDPHPLAQTPTNQPAAQTPAGEPAPVVGDGKQRFQGMIDRDGQEFELAITNLSGDGMINFNLMRTSDNVNEINPGGINEINELRPLETYVVQCDQGANNRPLKLAAVKNADGSASLTVSADEAKAKTDPKKALGTNLFLSVVPQLADNTKKLCERFGKTVWRCVPFVVVSQIAPTPIPTMTRARAWRDIDLESRGERLESMVVPESWRGGPRRTPTSNAVNLSFGGANQTLFAQSSAAAAQGGNSLGVAGPSARSGRGLITTDSNPITMAVRPLCLGDDRWQVSLPAPRSRSRSLEVDESESRGLSEDDESDKGAPAYANMALDVDVDMRDGPDSSMQFARLASSPPRSKGASSHPRYKGASSPPRSKGASGPGVKGDAGPPRSAGFAKKSIAVPVKHGRFGNTKRSLAASPASAAAARAGGGEGGGAARDMFGSGRDMVGAGRDMFDVIMDSKASRIEYGDRTIQVSSQQTGQSYDYEHPSRPCVLGLSVSFQLVFSPLHGDEAKMKTEAQELLVKFVNRKYDDFLQKSKIYTVSECSICLDAEPDVVFFQCGHACTHDRCSKTLDKCPFCRAPIAARLKSAPPSGTNTNGVVTSVVLSNAAPPVPPPVPPPSAPSSAPPAPAQLPTARRPPQYTIPQRRAPPETEMQSRAAK